MRGTEGEQVAPRIHEPARDAVRAQHLNRAVDRKSLGNAAEIDADLRRRKADAVAWKKNDHLVIARRTSAEALQS